MDERELIGALRKQLAAQVAQVDVKSMFSPLEATLRSSAGLIGSFLGKLTAVLAPLTTLATVLSQSTSGLGLFLSAVNVLAATLAPVLLPVFLVLGAAVLAISAMLWTRLKPALGDIYVWIVQSAIPAFRSFVEWLEKAGVAIDEFIEGLMMELVLLQKHPFDPEKRNELREAAKEFKELKAFNAAQGNKFDLNDPDQRAQAGIAMLREKLNGMEFDPRKIADRRAPNKPGLGGEAEREFKRGLLDMIAQFKFEQGSKASFTGLSAASREAQLAAIGTSPMERRMMEIKTDIINALGKIEGAVKLNKPEPAVGP